MNGVILPIVIFEMFFFGMMLGFMAGERNNPSEPKPKKWEQELHKEFIKGFKAGQKAMAKRMSERLKKEEIYRAMLERQSEDEIN